MKKYYTWNNGKRVRLFKRKPKNFRVIPLAPRTIQEAKLGLKYMEVI